MPWKKRLLGGLAAALGLALAVVCAAPFAYLFWRGLFPAEGSAALVYYQVFLGQSQYLVRFWKSLAMALAIAAGQGVVSALAGYGFARCRFPGRDGIFFALTVLMVLPVQVTLAPNYMMLDRMGLLDTPWALICPSVFLPLGTFLLRQSFRAIPDGVLDAARLDGCGLSRLLVWVALPMSRSGLVCALLLSFLDAWSMVERPLAFLSDAKSYPLAVALAVSPPGEMAVQLVCCVLVALPCLFLFLFFDRELTQGIAMGNLK